MPQSRIIREWTGVYGDRPCRATLYADRLVIGKPPASEVETFSIEELAAGKLRLRILDHFDPSALEEMHFLANVELAAAGRRPSCRCEVFSADNRCDPSTIEKLGLIHIDPNEPGDDQYTVRCHCAACGRCWEIGVNCGYHYTLYLWSPDSPPSDSPP